MGPSRAVNARTWSLGRERDGLPPDLRGTVMPGCAPNQGSLSQRRAFSGFMPCQKLEVVESTHSAGKLWPTVYQNVKLGRLVLTRLPLPCTKVMRAIGKIMQAWVTGRWSRPLML